MCESERGQRRPSASEQVAHVPEEESERDERRGLEEAGRGSGVADGDDLRGEDGEEHCYCEGCGDGGCEPEELCEEAAEGDGLAQADGGVGEVLGGGHVGVGVVLEPVFGGGAGEEVEEGQECQGGDEGGGQEVGEGGGAGFLGTSFDMLVVLFGGHAEDGDDLSEGW